MADRPILFSAPMVRALLAGKKTQTRRVVKPQPYVDERGNACWNGCNYGQTTQGEPLFKTLASPVPTSRTGRVLCPYGKPGDRLWVRETWGYNPDFLGQLGHVCYRADRGHEFDGIAWKPSIHMPRAASRITLEVTGVRVERLQSISEADAIAEGLTRTAAGQWLPGPCDHPEWAYHQLWDQINGDGAWDANPWVWVVEFRRVEVAHG